MKVRLVIAVSAIVAVALFLLGTVGWALGGLSCETDEAALNTVRCNPNDRGRSWAMVQAALLLCSFLALLGGTAWALVKARFAPFAVPAGLVIPVFVAVFAIGDIEPGDKPLPRLSGVSVLDRSCTVPCATGVRLVFTVDRDTEIYFELAREHSKQIDGRTYDTGVLRDGGADGVAEFEAGTHRVRVGGRITHPPEERGPLPEGDYKLGLIARPQHAGQSGQTFDHFTEHFTIRPRRP